MFITLNYHILATFHTIPKINFIELVFNLFKIKHYLSYKDLIPNDLKLFLIYKFTCASYSSSYIAKLVVFLELR